MPDYHAENTNVEQRLKLEDKMNELKKERADHQMDYYGIRSPRFSALATRWDKLRAKLEMVRKR
jgi:flagellar biosynthesis/type III secretory pathway chaperone